MLGKLNQKVSAKKMTSICWVLLNYSGLKAAAFMVIERSIKTCFQWAKSAVKIAYTE